VYLNGKKVGEWAYGYSYFYFDVSQFIQEGENTLSVKLSNKICFRWYPGAGLYRSKHYCKKITKASTNGDSL
jgi:beta-galactosidase